MSLPKPGGRPAVLIFDPPQSRVSEQQWPRPAQAPWRRVSDVRCVGTPLLPGYTQIFPSACQRFGSWDTTADPTRA